VTETALIARMRRHIADLVERYDIHCQCCRNSTQARSSRLHWSIRILRITDPVAYAVGLHEIGHLLGRYQDERNRTMTREVWAWKWAQATAFTWTAEMQEDKHSALEWYRPRVRNFDRLNRIWLQREPEASRLERAAVLRRATAR
jgi:hypothetical protein